MLTGHDRRSDQKARVVGQVAGQGPPQSLPTALRLSVDQSTGGPDCWPMLVAFGEGVQHRVHPRYFCGSHGLDNHLIGWPRRQIPD